jgi:N-acetylmuramoyl-L-alanine amidase
MDIAPLTIWRESRREGAKGMAAVAWVIRNRAETGNTWPKDPEERVCLQSNQFSCWNDGNAERDSYPDTGDQAYEVARFIWVNPGKDPTHGATFYVDAQAVQVNPFATSGFVKTAVIGRRMFYRAEMGLATNAGR